MRGGVYDDLLSEVCRQQIEACGLKLKEAEAAIIDATLIKAQPARARISRPRRTAPRAMSRTIQSCISVPIQTRGGSRRVQKSWVTRALPAPTKGLCPHTTSGRKPGVCDHETEPKRSWQGKAYASKANRDMLRSRHRDGIMRNRKSAAGSQSVVSASEQCFGTIKRLLGSVFLAFIVHDILDWQNTRPTGNGAMARTCSQAANKIKINPQAQAIA